MAEVIPFPEEIAHHQAINEKLHAALLDANREVDNLDAHYRDAKRYMVDNRGDIDPHEMFQSELALRQIDRSGAFAVQVRERLLKLQESPYFARIDFQAEGSEKPSPYYIGRFAFTHENELLIIDWRAPIAGMFYECKTGPAHYIAPQGRIDGALTLKRQFKIKNAVMEYAIESADNVQDEVLQRELSQTSDEKMKSIIATIQREQNIIIRNDRAKTLIIQGVAGSGKTSIALHRIAFLMYRFKERLSAKNVTILSPNKVFADYISNVLPELGEEPIFEVSLEDIADVQLEHVIDFEPDRNALETSDTAWAYRVQAKSTLAFVHDMDAFVARIADIAFEAKPYAYERFRVSAVWIETRLEAYKKYPLMRRLAMIADDIHDRFTTENIRGDELPRPGTILKALKAMLKYKNTLALYREFYRQQGDPKLFVMAGRQRLEWSDVYPFLYLHAAFFGVRDSQIIRHMVIDEMQDYTPIQFAVINRLFPCEKTILGDFGQAINPNHQHCLDDLLALYEDAEFVEMTTSYRSSYEIISFAKRICPAVNIQAIQRHGSWPEVIHCGNRAGELEALRQIILGFQEGEGNTLGIIVKTNEQAKALYDALGMAGDVHLIRPDSERFMGGISITSIQMAKGLEFDHVVVPLADKEHYHTEYDRRLLYVACTRAMHVLTLLHACTITPLLGE